jgi:hypothetical protein
MIAIVHSAGATEPSNRTVAGRGGYVRTFVADCVSCIKNDSRSLRGPFLFCRGAQLSRQEPAASGRRWREIAASNIAGAAGNNIFSGSFLTVGTSFAPGEVSLLALMDDLTNCREIMSTSGPGERRNDQQT